MKSVNEEKIYNYLNEIFKVSHMSKKDIKYTIIQDMKTGSFPHLVSEVRVDLFNLQLYFYFFEKNDNLNILIPSNLFSKRVDLDTTGFTYNQTKKYTKEDIFTQLPEVKQLYLDFYYNEYFKKTKKALDKTFKQKSSIEDILYYIGKRMGEDYAGKKVLKYMEESITLVLKFKNHEDKDFFIRISQPVNIRMSSRSFSYFYSSDRCMTCSLTKEVFNISRFKIEGERRRASKLGGGRRSLILSDIAQGFEDYLLDNKNKVSPFFTNRIKELSDKLHKEGLFVRELYCNKKHLPEIEHNCDYLKEFNSQIIKLSRIKYLSGKSTNLIEIIRQMDDKEKTLAEVENIYNIIEETFSKVEEKYKNQLVMSIINENRIKAKECYLLHKKELNTLKEAYILVSQQYISKKLDNNKKSYCN